MINLSDIPTDVLKAELLRRDQLKSDESKIRTILKKLSESEMENLEVWLKDDPAWVRSEVTRMLASIYDP